MRFPILLLLLAVPAAAQEGRVRIMDPVSNLPINASTVSGSKALKVDCVQGCSGSGGGSSDGIVRDGAGAGQADVVGSSPSGTEQALVVRNIPSGTQPVSGTVTVTDGTGPLTVDGTVAVTGTFWQTTQPVSGPLTDTQLRASAVPVSGAFFQATQPVSIATMPTTPVTGTFWQATQPVSGTVTATGPLTDTQLRATAVPISGSVTATGPLTDTQLRATAVPVSGTVSANATQTGTWTVQPGNTANTTPWLTTDSATGTTAAAPPSKATYIAVNANSTLEGLIQCDKVAVANIVTATNTQLVALSGTTKIYVCSYAVEIQGVVTTAGTVSLNYGTGSACATGTVQVTPAWVGSTTAGNPWSIMIGSNIGTVIRTTAGQALCATSTTTTPIKVFVTYAQF